MGKAGFLQELRRRHVVRVAIAYAVVAWALIEVASAALNGWGPQLTLTLGDAQRHAGHEAQAHEIYQRLVTQIEPNAGKMDDTIQPMMLALAWAGLGKNTQALAQAQRAVALYRGDAIYRPVAESVLAKVQVMTGDHQAAIAGLAHLLQAPGGTTAALLRLDPAWDPLRKAPRFQALLKQGSSDAGR